MQNMQSMLKLDHLSILLTKYLPISLFLFYYYRVFNLYLYIFRIQIYFDYSQGSKRFFLLYKQITINYEFKKRKQQQKA